MKKVNLPCLAVQVLVFILVWPLSGTAAGPDTLWVRNLRHEQGIDVNARGSTWLDLELCDVAGDSLPEIVTMFTHPNDSRLLVLDGPTGTIRSTFELPAKGFSNFHVLESGPAVPPRVAVGLQNGVIYTYDLASESLIDTLDHGKTIWILCCGDISNDGKDDFVIAGLDHVVTAYDGSSLQQLWMQSFPDHVHNLLLDDLDGDGRLEVAAGSTDELRVLDGSTGRPEWSLTADKRRAMGVLSGSNGATAISAADFGGRRVLVAGTVFGDIMILEGRNGEILKHAKIDAGYITNISTGDLDGDGVIDVVASSTDHKVYAVNGMDLDKVWEFRTDDEIYSSPALGDLSGDGLPDVLIVSDDDTAYCIDGRTGNELWHFDLETDCQAGYGVLGDLTGDGSVEIVLRGTRNGDLNVLESGAGCDPSEILWAQKWGDKHNTGALSGSGRNVHPH